MQWMAMLTMLIDHIGLIFFPDNVAWRIVGRIALPIYAYCIVIGLARTRDSNRYLRRLAIIALISQIPYILSLQTLNVNVVGTLAASLAALLVIDRYPRWAIAVIVACTVAIEAIPFSYGYYALLLILIYRYLDRNYWVAAHFALNLFSLALDSGWWVQTFSIVPTIYLAYKDTLFAEFKLGVAPPRWVWRSFYPAHLAALAVIAAIANA